MWKNRVMCLGSASLLLGAYAGSSWGQPAEPGMGFLAEPLEYIQTSGALWRPVLAGYARNLFLAIAGIDLAILLTKGILLKQEQLMERVTFRIGVQVALLVLLTVAPGSGGFAGAGMVIDWAGEVGRAAGGIEHVRPGAFMEGGIRLGSMMFERQYRYILPWTAAPHVSLMSAAGIVTMLSFGLISIFEFLIAVESTLLTSAGFVVLAFSASEYTVEWAEQYFTWLLRSSMRVMTLHLLSGMTFSLLRDWLGQVQNFGLFEMKGYIIIGLGAVFLLVSVVMMPVQMSSLIQGRLNLRGLYQS